MRGTLLPLNVPFIVPRFGPAGASVHTATELRPLPMSIGALNRFLFVLCGPWWPSRLGVRDRKPMTSYSLRRFAPSLATMFGLLLHERLPLGNWRSEALSKADRATAASASMPVLHTGDEARTLPCFHEYHAVCIETWLRTGRGGCLTCPICHHPAGSPGIALAQTQVL